MIAFPPAKDFLFLIGYIFCNLAEKDIALQELGNVASINTCLVGYTSLLMLSQEVKRKVAHSQQCYHPILRHRMTFSHQLLLHHIGSP